MARTSTLPSSSRATVTVSRSKNSGPRTGPTGSEARLARRALGPAGAALLAVDVATPLVHVQGLVRQLVHRLPVHTRPPGGDPDAELDRRRRLGEPVELLERRAHASARLVGVALVCVGHRDPELIAAEPAASVGGADRTLELVGQDADGLVAYVVAMRVIDLFQVVEVDHHEGDTALVALRGGDRAVDLALELWPVGEPGEVVGARLFSVLPSAVQGDRDLVGDRGDELQVAGLEGSRQAGRGRHGSEQDALRSQLRAGCAPFARDAVAARLRPPGSNLQHAHPRPRSAGLALLLLARPQAEGLGQPQPRALARPHPGRPAAQDFRRLPRAALGGLRH